MTNWLDDQLFSNRTIAANGVALPARPTLNIIGATVEDDAANGRTVVTITGGGGGGGTGAVAVVDVSGGDVTLDSTAVAASSLVFIGATDAQRVVTFPDDPTLQGYLVMVSTSPSTGDGSILFKCPSDTDGAVAAYGGIYLVTYALGAMQALTIAQLPVNAAQLQGHDVANTTPLDGNLLTYNAFAAAWEPTVPASVTPPMIVTWVTAPTALGVSPAYTMPGATRIDASPTVPFRLPIAVVSTFRTISVIAYQAGTYDFRATLWTSATYDGALSGTSLEVTLPGGDTSAAHSFPVSVSAGGAIALEIEVSGTGPTAPTGLCVVLSG